MQKIGEMEADDFLKTGEFFREQLKEEEEDGIISKGCPFCPIYKI